MNRDTETLSKLFMFRQISSFEISEFCSAAQPFTYGTGDIVYRQGEPSNGGLLIVSGSLTAYIGHGGTERTLGDSKPGEIVGETGIFSTGSNRTANVKATEPTRCLFIDSKLLEQTGDNQVVAALETYLLSSIARRIRKTGQTIQLFWRDMESSEEIAKNNGEGTSFREKLTQFFVGRR